MNTPRKKKRFSSAAFAGASEDGTWQIGLQNDDYKRALGSIVADFEQVEFLMPTVLGILLGVPLSDVAGYVFRSVRNPSIKASLMQHLLEIAPRNVDAPEFLDEILSEYGAIRALRNEYVHGLWSTKQEDGATFLARFPEHGGFMPGESKREPLEKLTALITRIHQMHHRLLKEAYPHANKLRQQLLEQAMRDVERQAEHKQHREIKARQRRPQPSEE